MDRVHKSRRMQSPAKRSEVLVDAKRGTNGATAAQSSPSFSNTLPVELLAAREAVMVRLRPILRDHDVTEQQWRVLRTLNEVEEIASTELANRALLLPSSLSRILRDLLERGFIHRRAPESDMRRGLISITRKGQVLIERAAPEMARAQAEIEAMYGSKELANLRALLRGLVKALQDET
jgi:homoprotocatechuate degradation regulator HpaR